MKYPPSTIKNVIADDWDKQQGCPHYIRGNKFDTKASLQSYSVNDKVVTVRQQLKELEMQWKEEEGWLCYLCGDFNRMQMYSLKLFKFISTPYYGFQTTSKKWVRLTNGYRQFDEHTPAKALPIEKFMILDSLLTHGDLISLDYARASKIFDIIAKRRGRSSIIVLCPDLTPEESIKLLKHDPDIIGNFKKVNTREG